MSSRLNTVLVFIFVGVSAFLGLEWQSASVRASRTRATADSLQQACSTWTASYDSLKKNCAPAPEEEHDSHFYMRQAVKARENQWMLLSEYEIRDLNAKGLADPVNDLRNDLKAHPELIPLKPSPTLRWGIGPIALLSTRWAYAHFEDGHYGGNALLEYEILPGGKIRWKVPGAGLM